MLIDPKSSIPIFCQIADQLRRAMDSGVYKPGEMLPSLRAMAVDIKVNPNTVQRAYESLEREGIVETRRGVGVFVAIANRDRRNAAEDRLCSQLLTAIRLGAKADLTPAAIRSCFETSLRQFLAGAKR